MSLFFGARHVLLSGTERMRCVLWFQLTIHTPLSRRVGPVTLYRWTMILGGVLMLFTPFSSAVADKPSLVWSSMFACVGLTAIVNVLSYVPGPWRAFRCEVYSWIYLPCGRRCCVVLPAAVCRYNSTFQIVRVSTTAENLGVANGISQSLVALARGVGPAIGTSTAAPHCFLLSTTIHCVSLPCAALFLFSATVAMFCAMRSIVCCCRRRLPVFRAMRPIVCCCQRPFTRCTAMRPLSLILSLTCRVDAAGALAPMDHRLSAGLPLRVRVRVRAVGAVRPVIVLAEGGVQQCAVVTLTRERYIGVVGDIQYTAATTNGSYWMSVLAARCAPAFVRSLPVSMDRYSFSASSTMSAFVKPFRLSELRALACFSFDRCSATSVFPACFSSPSVSLPPVCRMVVRAQNMPTSTNTVNDVQHTTTTTWW